MSDLDRSEALKGQGTLSGRSRPGATWFVAGVALWGCGSGSIPADDLPAAGPSAGESPLGAFGFLGLEQPSAAGVGAAPSGASGTGGTGSELPGSGGTGGAAPASSAECDAMCAVLTTPACPYYGPAECAYECAFIQSTPGCSSQATALINCLAGLSPASISCDLDGGVDLPDGVCLDQYYNYVFCGG